MLSSREKDRLGRLAAEARLIYGVPVYLVGSALMKRRPRDYDIRLRLSSADFAARFGDPAQWLREGETGDWTDLRWRWSNECCRQSSAWTIASGLNVDFQIYPPNFWRTFSGFRRLRLA